MIELFDVLNLKFKELFNELENFKKENFKFINSLKTPSVDDENFEYFKISEETDTHIIIKETWKSKDESTIFTKHTTKLKDKNSEEDLKMKLKEAVEKEDYLLAAKIKDQLEKIKKGE